MIIWKKTIKCQICGKAREIAAELGIGDLRILRKLARYSGGKILSAPGRPGYIHTCHASEDEMKEVTARLDHQADEMRDRAWEIRLAFQNNRISKPQTT